MSHFQPVTLTGQHVTLEPLKIEQHDELIRAVSDGHLWQLWYTSIPSPDTMHSEILRRLSLQESGSMLPFVIRRNDTGQLCGMTTYMNIDAVNCRVEIGSTWLAKHAQGTAINTESKYLLLSHAFETLQCIAVEFRTHWMNHQSRAAIAKLGAKQDGILRNHMRMPDGALRDTVVFSILNSEWAVTKRHLLYRLGK
jgi:RimJ/RimL family protein N-acetyltransferase